MKDKLEFDPMDSFRYFDYHRERIRMKIWCERMISDHQNFIAMMDDLKAKQHEEDKKNKLF